MTSVLFVCTGNICRSPTAEGVFRHFVQVAGLADQFQIESAGTSSAHVGEPPDSRSQRAARQRGYDLSAQRARQVQRDDFHRFDLILAMDAGHLRQLQRMAPKGSPAKLALFLDYAPNQPVRDVPDPYYGGPDGFSQVLDLIEAGAEGVLRAISTTQ